MTDDIPDAVWIKNGKLITPVQNSEFAEKYHKSPPVVDVEKLASDAISYFLSLEADYPATGEGMVKACLDHLIAEGIIQEKKT